MRSNSWQATVRRIADAVLPFANPLVSLQSRSVERLVAGLSPKGTSDVATLRARQRVPAREARLFWQVRMMATRAGGNR